MLPITSPLEILWFRYLINKSRRIQQTHQKISANSDQFGQTYFLRVESLKKIDEQNGRVELYERVID